MTTLSVKTIGAGSTYGRHAVTIPIPVPEGARTGDRVTIGVEAEGVDCGIAVTPKVLVERAVEGRSDTVCAHEWHGRLGDPIEASFTVVFRQAPTTHRVTWWFYRPGGGS